MNILDMVDFSWSGVYQLLKGDTVNFVCKKKDTSEEYLFVRNGTRRFGGTVKVYISGYVEGHRRILEPRVYWDSGYETARALDLWYALNREEVRNLSYSELVAISARMERYGRARTTHFYAEVRLRQVEQEGLPTIYVKIGDLCYDRNSLYRYRYYDEGLYKEELFISRNDYTNFYTEMHQKGFREYFGTSYNTSEINFYDQVPLPVWIDNGDICPECGSLYLTTNNPYHHQGECSVCHEDVILSYSTRAENKFDFKVGKDKFAFLGVELEVSCGEEDRAGPARAVRKLLKDHCILKSDGSINNGFEIVSAPAHIDVHKENFSKLFDNLPEELCEDESCGMHVHIDRKSLSVSQISRMTEFMNNNTEFIQKIAGRSLNSYCGADNSLKKSRAFQMKAKGSNRYSAINLCPNNTVEVRIFASTLDKETFERNLEFVKALVKFSRPGELDVSVKETLKDKHFFKWMVGQPRSEYPTLKPFILKNFAK